MSTFPTMAVWSVTDDELGPPRVYPTKREAMADAQSTHDCGLNPQVYRHGITRGDRRSARITFTPQCQCWGLPLCEHHAHFPDTGNCVLHQHEQEASK